MNDPEIITKVQKSKSLNIEKLIIVVPLLAFCAALFAFAIYKLTTLFYLYYQLQKEKRHEHEKKHKKGMNQLLLVENDNEVYMRDTSSADADDEYNKITQAIQDSFKDYQEYNDKLNNFYQTTRKTSAPDIIDASVLSAMNDNY